MIGHASHVTKCTMKVSTDAYQGSGAKEREAERPFLKEGLEDLYLRIGLVVDEKEDQDERGFGSLLRGRDSQAPRTEPTSLPRASRGK